MTATKLVTAAQVRKLDALVGKIEALQNEITEPAVLDALRRTKAEAFLALRKAELFHAA